MICGLSSVMISPLGVRTTAAARPMAIWGGRDAHARAEYVCLSDALKG
jgi:predicted benzoate:H+ symporter BenE